MLTTQPVYLKAFTGHLFLRLGAAHQGVAAGVGGGNHQQQDDEAADLERLVLPHLEPGRVGLDDHGAAAFEVPGVEPVFLVEVGEGLGRRLLVDLVAEENQLPGIGAREALAADDEDGRFVEGRRAAADTPHRFT
jgi:hypothetical protein